MCGLSWRLLGRRLGVVLAVVLGLVGSGSSGWAQLKGVGDVAEVFELRDVLTDEVVGLGELEGSVVVLDFFFYWCSICRGHSAVVESEVGRYYRERGGNAAGVPVVVVGLEKDWTGISSGGTRRFAEGTGLEFALDDSEHVALHQFFSPSRGEGTKDSDFVVLNGVVNSPSHALWEVVFVQSRPRRNEIGGDLREAIDSIAAGVDPVLPPVPPVPPVVSGVQVSAGRFGFLVEGAAGGSGVVEFSRDGVLWDRLGEVVFEEGAVLWEDAQPADELVRFYRVVVGGE